LKDLGFRVAMSLGAERVRLVGIGPSRKDAASRRVLALPLAELALIERRPNMVLSMVSCVSEHHRSGHGNAADRPR